MTTALIITLAILCLLMILTVMIQRGRGGGMAGAFGSGGGANSAFGTKTGDVFTVATIVLFALFLGLSIALNFAFAAGAR